jgi:hypothetical protein
MKIVLTILALTAILTAEDKPCLIVQSTQGNRLVGLAAAGVVGLALAHGERFPYLESRNLPIHDVKDQYKRKDLEKLESKGVKVIVTNGSQRRGRAAVQVTSQNSEGLDDDLARARRACQEDAK